MNQEPTFQRSCRGSNPILTDLEVETKSTGHRAITEKYRSKKKKNERKPLDQLSP